MTKDDVIATGHYILFVIFFGRRTSLASLIAFSGHSKLRYRPSTFNDVVSNFKDSFLVLEIFKDIGIHLNSDFKTLIKDRSQSIIENTRCVLAHREFSIKLSIFIEY